jgi:catechol 2,3-dioxygenase-like lactoylglutathione lyase family enzyme
LIVATKTEAAIKQAVPFFMVANIQKSLDFYVAGLGFEMTNQWIDDGKLRWCWLQQGRAALMLQEYPAQTRQRLASEAKVLGVGVSIYFICEDALAIYREFTSRGVKAGRPFVGNAMWVTSITDPDGYKLFFESPTDVAEETVYSEREGQDSGEIAGNVTTTAPLQANPRLD